MNKNQILLILSSLLLSLFIFSSCGGDKDEPTNELVKKTFVAQMPASEGSEELYFISGTKLKLEFTIKNLPEETFFQIEGLENAEAIKEKVKALVKQGLFNKIPLYFAYTYNEQTGALTLQVTNESGKAFSDLMANKVLPIAFAEKLQEMSELEKGIALEGMRKGVEMEFKKVLQMLLQNVQSIVYKKAEAKIYATAINPETQEVETTIFTEKQ